MNKQISPQLKRQICYANCLLLMHISHILHILLNTLYSFSHPHCPGNIWNIALLTPSAHAPCIYTYSHVPPFHKEKEGGGLVLEEGGWFIFPPIAPYIIWIWDYSDTIRAVGGKIKGPPHTSPPLHPPTIKELILLRWGNTHTCMYCAEGGVRGSFGPNYYILYLPWTMLMWKGIEGVKQYL